MPLVISSFIAATRDLAHWFSDTANMNNLCWYHLRPSVYKLLGEKKNSTNVHELREATNFSVH